MRKLILAAILLAATNAALAWTHGNSGNSGQLLTDSSTQLLTDASTELLTK